MAWSDAAKLHSIKDFLGAKTTSTVAPDFESWDNQSETHGAASYEEEEETVTEAAVPFYEEEEETVTEAAVPLPPAPEPAQEVVQERPAKRLKLVKTSPKPRPKIVKQEQPAPQPDPYQEYGASYDYGLAAQDIGSMLGLDQFVGAGASGASGTDSGEREGDTFKTMSREQKMRWFDQNGSDLLRDSSDENFRRLFGCGRGRTPAWKESFQVWCARNQHHVDVAPSSSSSSSKWSELHPSQKQSIFTKLQSALGYSSSCAVDEAERELKTILKDACITTQGASDKKLREFSAFSGMSISGLRGDGQKRPREDESVRDLLHRAIDLHTRSGGTVSVSAVYAMFGM